MSKLSAASATKYVNRTLLPRFANAGGWKLSHTSDVFRLGGIDRVAAHLTNGHDTISFDVIETDGRIHAPRYDA